MGPTWAHLGPTGPRWAPCWPHELCYLGSYRYRTLFHSMWHYRSLEYYKGFYDMKGERWWPHGIKGIRAYISIASDRGRRQFGNWYWQQRGQFGKLRRTNPKAGLFLKMVVVVIVGFVHDDVIKWQHFPRYWPFVRGIHRPPVNSPHKGQWRRALMFFI